MGPGGGPWPIGICEKGGGGPDIAGPGGGWKPSGGCCDCCSIRCEKEKECVRVFLSLWIRIILEQRWAPPSQE